jgi:hypothetical protein
VLHTKLVELDDVTLKDRVMKETSRWSVGSSTEDEEQLLTHIKYELYSMERDPSETESAAMSSTRAASAIRSLRVHLGNNNLKASKSTKLHKFGGAVDLVGPQAEQFQELLSCEDSQFAVAQMLADLESEDVRRDYKVFTQRFADALSQVTWTAEDCDDHEKGLIEQEKQVSETFERERQHKKIDQPSWVLASQSSVGKPSRSSLPSQTTEDRTLTQQAKRRRRRTETGSLPQAQPMHGQDVSKQPQGLRDPPNVNAAVQVLQRSLAALL